MFKNDLSALNQKTRQYLEAGDVDSALDTNFEAICLTNPRHNLGFGVAKKDRADLLLERGLLLGEKGRFTQAMDFFERSHSVYCSMSEIESRKFYFEHLEVKVYLSGFLCDIEHWDEATKVLNGQENKNFSEEDKRVHWELIWKTKFILAEISMRKGTPEDSRKFFIDAQKICELQCKEGDPNGINLYLTASRGVGETLSMQFRYKEALAYYIEIEEIIHSQPSNAPFFEELVHACHAIARSLAKIGKYADAEDKFFILFELISEFKQSSSYDGDQIWSELELATLEGIIACKQNQDQFDGVEKYFLKQKSILLELDAEDTHNIERQCIFELNYGNFKNSISDYKGSYLLYKRASDRIRSKLLPLGPQYIRIFSGSLTGLVDLCWYLNQHKESIKMASEASTLLEEALKIGLPEAPSEFLNLLSIASKSYQHQENASDKFSKASTIAIDLISDLSVDETPHWSKMRENFSKIHSNWLSWCIDDETRTGKIPEVLAAIQGRDLAASISEQLEANKV